MPEIDKERLGGTMRLGHRETRFQPNTNQSVIRKLYGGLEAVDERHRHRYEVNPKYVEDLEKHGLQFVGRDDTGDRMEILELDRNMHPYYVGVQYHPEYITRPLKPSPPFLGLVLAASGQLEEWIATNSTDA